MSEPISCQEVVELVTSYLEDAMSDDERADFEAHLQVCPGCEDYLDQFRLTISELGELRVESLSAEAQGALLNAFRSWPKPG